MASVTHMDTSHGSPNNDVQTYLISRYREALKSGDKSFAKSCLLSTRLFSVDDPTITNEIYVMAKAEGDIGEAAKCFADLFDNLFINEKSANNLTDESLVVANQVKEETRILLNELKNQYLRLRSAQNFTSSSHNRHIPSVCQSPLLSPRLRMSSEDRTISRESVLRLDKHLNLANNALFYQQLLDNLSQDVRRNILNYSIDNCDNPFEQCRLMMLSISLFNDSVTVHGHRLLRTLIDLSQPLSDKHNNDCNRIYNISRTQSTCQYARSILVLDAIPLIFNIVESQSLEFDMDELIQQTVNYFSEFCLDKAAEEYEFRELHDGLKKAITARILAKDISWHSHEESLEEHLNISLNLLLDRFLLDFSNDSTTLENLKKLRLIVADRSDPCTTTSDRFKSICTALRFESDIPENILLNHGKDESPVSSIPVAVATPQKGRGRPKKAPSTVIVSPDDGVRRHLLLKAKEAVFVHTLFLQRMFTSSLLYLRQTRSRILISFDNPLATHIETEISKSSSQRSSRGKSLSSDTSGTNASKRMKTEPQSSTEIPKVSQSEDEEEDCVDKEESPLESEHSKRMDREIVEILMDVNRCIEFLMTATTPFKKLFNRFLEANDSQHLKWFSRIHVDCMMISHDFESASILLKKTLASQPDCEVKREKDSTELSTLTVSTGTSPSAEVYQLRALTQAVSCHIQIINKDSALQAVADLLGTIKRSGLLMNDSNYLSGNVIDEYHVLFSDNKDHTMGFLFFDALSLIRYAVVLLMDILKRYVNHPNPSSDSMIGHALVLSQVDWPNQVQIYDKCIAWIRANKPKSITPQCLSASTKFTYPDFFNHIMEPNILEDFMALLNEGITLDIKNSKQMNTSPGGSSSSQQTNTSATSTRSSSGSTRSGKAITTRGVNKTFKEDLKVALIAQMKNSSSLIPLDLVTTFVQTTLVPCLLSC